MKSPLARLLCLSWIVLSATTAFADQLSGRLVGIVQDGKTTDRQVFLQTASDRLELVWPAGKPAELPFGAQVTVTGDRFGSAFQVSSLGLASASIKQAGALGANAASDAPSIPSGPMRLLVILFDWPTEPWISKKPEEMRTMIFGTLNDYFQEQSYGKTSITGDLYGPWTLPIDFTTDINAIRDAADKIAAGNGISLSNYTNIMYVGYFIPYMGKEAAFGEVGSFPARAWINDPDAWVIAHELGHNLGLDHSTLRTCVASPRNPQWPDCEEDEYGDYYDTMGGGLFMGYPHRLMHFNALHKERLGWLKPLVVSTPGTYTLRPFEQKTSEPRALKVVTANQAFYVERRESTGFDTVNPQTVFATRGVLIHTPHPTRQGATQLLTLWPQQQNKYQKFYTAALPFGSSYTDAASRLRLSVAEGASSETLVTVDFGGVSSGTPPSGSLSAQAQAGDGAVSLNWNAIPGADSYWVLAGLDPAVTPNNASFSRIVTELSAWVPRLTNGMRYYFKVIAQSQNVEVASSPVITAVPGESTPTPPSTSGGGNVPATLSAVSGDGEVLLTWNAASGADSYRIYGAEGTSVSPASARYVLRAMESPQRVLGLSNGVTYTFAVSAVKDGAESGLSLPVSVTPSVR